MDKLDRIFTLYDIESLDMVYQKILNKYTFRNSIGDFVLCWDHSRFVNHSFHPNCMTTPYDYELAVRDISPGEELTNDYGTLNVTEPFYCLPERRTKRRIVFPDDLAHYYKKWDRQLLSAYKQFNNVEQPLAQFLPPDILEKSRSISNGKCEMDSIITCYYASKDNLVPDSATVKTEKIC